MEWTLSHDAAWLLWINQGWRNTGFDIFFGWVSTRIWFAFPLLFLFLYDSLRRSGRAGGQVFLALALTIGCGDMLGAWLKSVLAEARPCFDLFPLLHTPNAMPCGAKSSGMPSNHSLNFAAAAMFVWRVTPWREWHKTLWIVAGLVMLSRVYLGKHYPSQVLVGAALGMSVGWIGAWLALRMGIGGATLAESGWVQITPKYLYLWWKNTWQYILHTNCVVMLTTRSINVPRLLGQNERWSPSTVDLKATSPPSTGEEAEYRASNWRDTPATNARAELFLTNEKPMTEHTLSVVIPLYNEIENVEPLLERVHQALAIYPHAWELILVDDGSSDGTNERLLAKSADYGEHLRVLSLQRNFGQTAAMQAGIDYARGEVIATLDGDLQNDPTDIPRLVQRLVTEDLDLIVGWRQHRQDNLWLRKVPSRIANRLIAKITGVLLHDYGCSLKVYRAEVIRNVRLYGEMHRFIPAWVAVYTTPARIKEEPVQHHARQFGQSKYGISRTFRVIVDLLSVYFFMRFLSRPGHFFGRIGLIFGFLGGTALCYLFLLKIFWSADIGLRPLFLTGVLFMLMGVQFLTTGILGELMARIYFASGQTCPYVIRRDSGCCQEATQGWRKHE